MRSAPPFTLFAVLLACGDAAESSGSASSTSLATGTPTTDDPGPTPTVTGADTTAGDGTASAATSLEPTSTTGITSAGATTEDIGPKLDIGGLPDLGRGDPGEIPATCAAASGSATTIGCSFYALDLDNYTPWDTSQWGLAVANVQPEATASVVVEVKNGGAWEVVAGPQDVLARDLHVFELPDRHQEGSGVQPGGAYRVTADIPVIAYQFDPLGDGMDTGWASADASLLHPAGAWDTINHVLGIGSTSHLLPQQGAYVTIVAGHDDTVVTIVPSTATLAGPGVPAGVPGVAFDVALDEGDVVEVMTLTEGASLTGTRVTSNQGHPVGVFSGHECANIPAEVYACDHLEEQIPGVRRWGTSFVAARVPVRDPAAPEASLWQIYASEDDTEVTLSAAPGVTGLPQSPLVLDAGEAAEFMVAGTPADPGDFLIDATRPIAVANYMTSQDTILSPARTGDPAMVLLSPVEQYLSRYVVLVPGVWPVDFATITRRVGTVVTLGGVAVPDASFMPVGLEFEVARVLIPDGVHLLESDEPFMVGITGTHQTGSYAYLGGSATTVINPEPQG